MAETLADQNLNPPFDRDQDGRLRSKVNEGSGSIDELEGDVKRHAHLARAAHARKLKALPRHNAGRLTGAEVGARPELDLRPHRRGRRRPRSERCARASCPGGGACLTRAVAAEDPRFEEQLPDGRRRRAPLGILRRRVGEPWAGKSRTDGGVRELESPTGREEAAPLPRAATVRV